MSATALANARDLDAVGDLDLVESRRRLAELDERIAAR
jgi:hypothetical protein